MVVRNWRVPHRESIQYITPDGRIYNLHDPPQRAVLSMEGWGHPQVMLISGRGPYQDGESLLGVRLDAREIRMTVFHRATTRETFWTQRAALLDSLRTTRTDPNLPVTGRLRWTREDGSVYEVYCILGSAIPFSQSPDGFGIRETVTFVASDPAIYDPNTYIHTLTGFNAVNPQTENISYPGTMISFPTITITGPCDSIDITNTATSHTISISYGVSAGETVTIELTPDSKSIYNDSNTSLFGYLDVSSSRLYEFGLYPHPLATNGENPILVDLPGAAAATTATISYRRRYIGI